ncbi:MAG TPA: hypothetical protein VMM81_03695 [Acidimicrobiia bacterium]|nr:hypothetical protein [Acidimicrobiia bacterium]
MSAGRLPGGIRRGLLGVALVLAVLTAACGDDGEVATTTTTTVAVTTSTAAPIPVATCPGQRSERSDDWTLYRLEAEYMFLHPADWTVAAPAIIPAGDAFHADTLAEAGVGPEAEVSVLTVAGPSPSGVPGVHLVTLTGVTSPLEVLYARQEAHVVSTSSTDLREVLDAGVSGCLGDEPALGLVLLYDYSVVHVWSAVRAGTLYVFLLVAEDQTQVEVLDEVLRSWAW